MNNPDNGRHEMLIASIVLGIGLCGILSMCMVTAMPMSNEAEIGEASYYGAAFAGRQTASGEVFNPSALTAAHPTLPFGTAVRVTHLGNGKSVVVRINDRGPHVAGRIIDLSQAAARHIGIIQSGTAEVSIEVVD